jgi:hypothetical protein
MPTVNAIGLAYIRSFLVEEAKDPSLCADRELVQSLAAACEQCGYVALDARMSRTNKTVWIELPSWGFTHGEMA